MNQKQARSLDPKLLLLREESMRSWQRKGKGTIKETKAEEEKEESAEKEKEKEEVEKEGVGEAYRR